MQTVFHFLDDICLNTLLKLGKKCQELLFAILEGGELLLMQKLPTENPFGILCWTFLLIGFFGWLDFSDGGARLRRAIARSKRKDGVLGEKIAPS